MNRSGLSGVGNLVVVAVVLTFVVPGWADSIIVGSGLGVGVGCGASCGNIDIGTAGGYEISDRQRLAQSFVLNAVVDVSALDVAISAYSLNLTQVNVYLTDDLGSNASTLAAESFVLTYPSTPQVLSLTLDSQLQAGTYYVLLTSSGGAESSPEGTVTESAIGSVGSAYYANSALGLNPTVAGWQSFNSATVGFELMGREATAVPEPDTLVLMGSGMIFLPCWLKHSIRKARRGMVSRNPVRRH